MPITARYPQAAVVSTLRAAAAVRVPDLAKRYCNILQSRLTADTFTMNLAATI